MLHLERMLNAYIAVFGWSRHTSIKTIIGVQEHAGNEEIGVGTPLDWLGRSFASKKYRSNALFFRLLPLFHFRRLYFQTTLIEALLLHA